MRVWTALGALLLAAAVVLGIGLYKYEQTRGTYAGYLDESTGRLTVPGMPDPGPWLWTGGSALCIVSLVAVGIGVRQRGRAA